MSSTFPVQIASVPIPVPPQFQMPQLRWVPKPHFSSPVLPHIQTLLRLHVKAGLQDTAKVSTVDQQHPSLLKESAWINPYPHLIGHLSGIRASPLGLGPLQFP